MRGRALMAHMCSAARSREFRDQRHNGRARIVTRLVSSSFCREEGLAFCVLSRPVDCRGPGKVATGTDA